MLVWTGFIKTQNVFFGTLGVGNHFIEVNQDENGVYYLTVHSGTMYFNVYHIIFLKKSNIYNTAP